MVPDNQFQHLFSLFQLYSDTDSLPQLWHNFTSPENFNVCRKAEVLGPVKRLHSSCFDLLLFEEEWTLLKWVLPHQGISTIMTCNFSSKAENMPPFKTVILR